MLTILKLLQGFREGSARRSAVRTLGSLSAAQLRDLGIPADGIDDFVGTMLAVHHSRRANAAAATSPLPSVAAARNPVAAAGNLQVCG